MLNFYLQSQNFQQQKSYNMLDSIADKYVYKIASRYIQKRLSYDIKHVKNLITSFRDLTAIFPQKNYRF